jgi:nitrite reductase/ring-hydroxylating ferredoxin subunit/uncharacterized membrane protein
MVRPAQAQIEDILVRSPRIDRQIDQVGESLQGVIRGLFEGQGEAGERLRNFLHGVWLGHPLHAAITDLPVGAWTTAQIFDYLGAISGNRSIKVAGDLATGVGVIGGVAAAFAGLADYSETEGEQRRYGTVHAILNAVGLVLMSVSLVRRIGGDRAAAIPIGTLGYAMSFISADLGGTMVYKYGTGVSRQAWTSGPRDFVRVLSSSELSNGQLRAGAAQGVPVLLARVNGQVFAVGDTCTHWGCSLSEGYLVDSSVRCHCHGSRFDLATGAVLDGPASVPEPTFDVREQNGQIEVRERPY